MLPCNHVMNRGKRNEWKRENLMNAVVPNWVTDNSLNFDIQEPGYYLLNQEYEALKKLCGLVHGPAQKKSQGVSDSEWSLVTHGMFARYCPLGMLCFSVR